MGLFLVLCAPSFSLLNLVHEAQPVVHVSLRFRNVAYLLFFSSDAPEHPPKLFTSLSKSLLLVTTSAIFCTCDYHIFQTDLFYFFLNCFPTKVKNTVFFFLFMCFVACLYGCNIYIYIDCFY